MKPESPKYTARALFDPRRVRLQFRGPGVAEYELAPLGAVHLSGLLFSAALEAMDPKHELGARAEGYAELVLWSVPSFSEFVWVPETFGTVRELRARVQELRSEGLPYRITLDVFHDPLEPRTPSEARTIKGEG